MNIPVAHTQGGEVSGSIDESVRHAVTKLAHVHFPATELARAARDRDGRGPGWVFNVGCPSIDLVAAARTSACGRDALEQLRRRRRADRPRAARSCSMMQHPVTTEYGAGLDQINETLEAVARLGMQALVFWPNVDAGSEHVAKGIRMFRETRRARTASTSSATCRRRCSSG